MTQPINDSGLARDKTLRQEYAGLAMHAQIIAAGMSEDAARSLNDAAESLGKTVHQQIAYCANVMADAMIAHEQKEQDHDDKT